MIDVDCFSPMPRVTNPLWHVRTSNGQSLVLKMLPEYPPGASRVDEFRVLGHLQARGVPVALPLLTDTATIHATVSGRQFSLIPLVPSQSANHDLEPGAADTAFAIGGAIAEMNHALAAYPWVVRSFTDDPERVLSEALPALPDEAARPIAPIVDRLRAAVSDLPTQLTHGDCNNGNVLVDGGRVSGFLDFDHLPVGPRVRDLSYYLVSRLRTQLSEQRTVAESVTAFRGVLTRYVAGYDAASPLTPPERQAVVPLMLLIGLGGAHWCLHGWEPNPDGYRANLRSITWIAGQFDAMATAVAAPDA